MADSTRVGWPQRSMASWRARALITVASIPMVSEVARSRPLPAALVPRQMLPPPMTMASSTPSSARAWAISEAMRSTTAASMVSSEAADARASPDILSTTRRQRGWPGLVAGKALSAPTPPSAPHRHLGEAGDPRRPQPLGDRLLLVLHPGLLQQAALLEPAVEPALHDLGQGGLRLSLVAAERLQRGPLGLDLLGRDVVAAQVERAGEGDVQGHVVGQLGAGPECLHDDPVDPPVGLDVQVGAEHRLLGALEAHRAAHGDVLLERDGKVLHRRGPLPKSLLAAPGQLLGQVVHQVDEVWRLGHEVGLAAQLHGGGCAAGHGDRYCPLGLLPALALGRPSLAPLPKPLGRPFQVATRGLQGLLAVQHPGPGQLAQRLDLLGAGARHQALPLAATDAAGAGSSAPSSWREAMKRPSFTASAMIRHIRVPDRMASSLPGMT